jgi:hypothetical protein
MQKKAWEHTPPRLVKWKVKKGKREDFDWDALGTILSTFFFPPTLLL